MLPLNSLSSFNSMVATAVVPGAPLRIVPVPSATGIQLAALPFRSSVPPVMWSILRIVDEGANRAVGGVRGEGEGGASRQVGDGADVVLDFALGWAGVEDAGMLSRYDSQSHNMHS